MVGGVGGVGGEVGGDELGGGCVDGAAEGFDLAALHTALVPSVSGWI